MNTQIETCKRCGRHVTGVVDYGLTGMAANQASKMVVKHAGNAIMPGLGTALNLTGVTTKAAQWGHEAMTTEFSYDFKCTCGNSWSNKIKHTDEHIPEAILEAERQAAIQTYKGKLQSNIVWSIISAIAFIPACHYCWVNDFITKRQTWVLFVGDTVVNDYHFSWLGVLIIAIFSGCVLLLNLLNFSDNRKAVKTLKKVSAKVYKHSIYRIKK